MQLIGVNFHGYESSSYQNSNSVMSRYYEKMPAEHATNYNTKKDFWNRWWNRKIETADGKDGWDAQLSFFADIIKLFNNRKSTFGFEILNEPEVFSLSHYNKIRQYHDYMIKELRKITNKPLIFCWALPHGSFDTPILQAHIFPSYHKNNNVIYDGHSYPLSLTRMIYFRLIRRLMGNVPLYIGEFNSGFTNGAVLAQDLLYEYIKMCKRFEVYGCALWRWCYIHDQNIPAFNLTHIVDGKIQPGIYFKYFLKALREVNNVPR